jgi:hypothetical protein
VPVIPQLHDSNSFGVKSPALRLPSTFTPLGLDGFVKAVLYRRPASAAGELVDNQHPSCDIFDILFGSE